MTPTALSKLEELWEELVDTAGSESTAEFILDRILKQVMVSSWKWKVLDSIR